VAATIRRDLCASAGIFGSYITIYFCHFGGSPLPFGLTCALLLSILICALGSTADVFFIPQLNYLSALLHLPPDVAGITLLALGNGAPDVFTAVAVARETDFPLFLSDVLGGSVFTITVVLGAPGLWLRVPSPWAWSTALLADPGGRARGACRPSFILLPPRACRGSLEP